MRALETDIAALASDLPGRVGVVIRYPDAGLEATFNPDDLFPTASVIKVPIMVEVYHQVAAGTLHLDDLLPLVAEEIAEGSGMLQYLHPGLPLTVADALELMIAISDNTATNLLLARVGKDAVNATMNRLGLTQTRSMGPLGKRDVPNELSFLSRTTPREMAILLTEMAQGRLVSPEASAAMLRTMDHQAFDDMLPRYLPVTSDRHIQIGHKTGAIGGVRNDAGVMRVQAPAGTRTAVVSAFTADVEDGDLWTPENPAARTVAEVGRLAHRTLLQL